MGGDLWELYEYGEADDEVAAIIRLAHFGATPPGVKVITQFEEIITVRLQRGDIPKISGASETAGMSSGDTYFGADVEYDAVDSETLPPTSAISTDHRRPDDLEMTGRGIVIGVVDWGFDFRHPDFRKPDGSSRILALWDQRGGKQANSPEPYGYGIVHTREAINKALGEKDPYATLQYHPADADTGNGCHGTHVASIAAGSGGEDRPMGIAPEADIVFVHNAPWDGLESGKLGDSVTLLEAIDFISRTAAGRPWVINLSMGRHGEQHDGTTLIEQGLDAAVRAAAGRAICLSAGNYYNKRTHASGQLRPTQSRSLAWVVNEKNPSDYNQLEVWYSWQDKFDVAVRSPDGSIVAQTRLGEKVKLMAGGKEIGNLYHRAQEPNTLDHHVTLYLYKAAPAGEWTVTLVGTDVIHGHYHCWIEREVSCPKCQSHFKTDDADPTSTTGTICNGRRTIAVGAYDPHDPGYRIGAFSSVGPTRDGRLKPDLCAPGVSILAARSAKRDHPDETPLTTRMSGTSMAAPFVAGSCALAFQAAVRPLRIEETHNLLLGSARRVTVEDSNPERVGIGFIDVAAFVDAAGRPDNGQRTFVPVREQRGAAAPPKQAHEIARATESIAATRSVAPTADIAEAFVPPRVHGGLEPMVEDESLRQTPGLRIGAEESEALNLLGTGDEGDRRTRVNEPVSQPTATDTESETAAFDGGENSYEASFVLLKQEPQPEPVSEEPADMRAFLESLASSTTARDLFDVFAHDAELPRAASFRNRFDLIAAPRASLGGDVRGGDLLVRTGAGGSGYVGVLGCAPLTIENAIARGLTLERRNNGYFAPVIEPGALSQMLPSSLARQLADAGGLLPHNQIVLRPRRGLGALVDRAEASEVAQVAEYVDVAGRADFSEDEQGASSACRVIDQFPHNHAEVQPAHSIALAEAARDILEWRVAEVRVIGHASRVGSDAYNDELARHRAENVAAALRRLMDSHRPGAGRSVTFSIESRGSRDPVSAEQARNRRVEICFARPIVPPGPLPAPPSVEARLRALLTASMVLAGNASAPFTLGALPTVAPISGALWSYSLRFSTSGTLEARDVTCWVRHTTGRTSHTMQMQVLDYIAWEDPTIQMPGGTAITLPLRPAYLLGSFQSAGGHIAPVTHPLWRLESAHEHGSAMVFGYDLSQGGAPRPLTSLDDFEPGGAGGGRATRVLVVCEFVVCGSRNDFEPLGVLDAGRLYPIAEIITDGQGADIQMAVDMRRPDVTRMDHGWLSPNHISNLYADRNIDQGELADISRFFRGSAAPFPTWENMFDYYDRNPSRAAISAVVVDPALTGIRSNSVDREKWVRSRLPGAYAPTVVQKQPRQGEYDNIHVAPQMAVSLPAIPMLFGGFGPVGVSMAPVCSHDCFHMHWRWGWGFRNIESLGWGPRGPYTEPGAPMVPLNQKIRIETPAGHAGMRYVATADHQPAGDWAVVMHHGASYALHVRISPFAILDAALAAMAPGLGAIITAIRALVGANDDLAWAWIYFFFQYSPTLRPPHMQENVLIHSLTALRRL